MLIEQQISASQTKHFVAPVSCLGHGGAALLRSARCVAIENFQRLNQPVFRSLRLQPSVRFEFEDGNTDCPVTDSQPKTINARAAIVATQPRGPGRRMCFGLGEGQKTSRTIVYARACRAGAGAGNNLAFV